jgi:hypothetical protein
MPGLLQYRIDVGDVATSLSASKHPEGEPLWLPSTIDQNRRQCVCINDLPLVEEKLGTAQCHNALELVCHVLKVKSRMVAFKNQNIWGQRENLRSRSVISKVHERARTAADKYRNARNATLALSGPGDWKKELRVLHDADIRSYQDPNHLRACQGRRGMLEDDQIEQSGGGSVSVDDNAASFTLFTKEWSNRDGTEESRRTLSWIWLNNTEAGSLNDAGDDILRVEWAKSRARSNRATEEVLLLLEEMRRVLLFLEWKSQRLATLSITGALCSTLSDFLDAHAGVLPVELMLKKSCHRAMVRMTTLPSSHSLHQIVQKVKSSLPSKHLSPIDHLIKIFKLQRKTIETIMPPTESHPNRFTTEIADSRKDSIAQEVKDNADFKIFSDGSGQDGYVGAAAVIYKKGVRRPVGHLKAHLGPLTKHTTYEGEAVGGILALWLARETPGTIAKQISLYIDNQSLITATKNPKSVSGQYLLQDLRKAANSPLFKLKIRWISGHSKVGKRGSNTRKQQMDEQVGGRNSLPSYGKHSQSAHQPPNRHNMRNS